MGVSTVAPGTTPFAWLADGLPDGCCGERVFGTYLHGAFEDAGVVAELLGLTIDTNDRDLMYDKLADWLVEHSSPLVLENLLRS